MSARKKPAAQLEFSIPQHGGKRRGAGRKKISHQANHVARPRVKASAPLHITIKVRKGIRNLRQATLINKTAAAFERAKNFGLRIIHFTLQSDHVHLICEADSNKALERGMKSLTVTLAKPPRWVHTVRGAGSEPASFKIFEILCARYFGQGCPHALPSNQIEFTPSARRPGPAFAQLPVARLKID